MNLLPIAISILLAFLFIFALVKAARSKRLARKAEKHAARVKEAEESLVNLFGHVSQTVRTYYEDKNVNSGELKAALLSHFTLSAQKTFTSGCAAYFSFDREQGTLRLSECSGLFPSCLDISEEKLKLVAGNDAKLQEYLKNTSFPLHLTPFAAAVDQKRVVVFGKNECEERVRYKVYALWGMLIVPVRSQGAVTGVLVIANKAHKAAYDSEDVELARGMSEIVSWTLNYLAMIEGVREKASVDSQLETAASIQSHLLPKSRAQMGIVEAEAFYKTAYRVGGDYFDFIEVDEDHLGILVADVSGKGIPAGLVMASTRALMSALSKHVLSPSKLLTDLNTHLIQLIPEEMFVTASYAVINTKTGEMLCAEAGHEPFLAALSGQPVVTCENRGMVLSILDSEIFGPSLKDTAYQLQKGDMVLFYTDGAVEALNRKKEEFTRERLSVALENARNLSPYEALQSIQGRLAKFTEGEPPYDDVTLVAVKIN
ncbi:SpoIIE family protein phosphatase [bacterium]|jgi:sigma-B regulation protein RsbU (phosphoserine phosphatase)|nr:SpoIIE family protein phosphatase [bacterium]